MHRSVARTPVSVPISASSFQGTRRWRIVINSQGIYQKGIWYR